MIMNNQPVFTEEYLSWIKQADLPPLTNTQHSFAEWLLLEENAKIISQIGSLDEIFTSIRKYLKNKK